MAKEPDSLAEEDLVRSDLTLEDAEKAGFYVVDSAREVDDGFKDLPALVLPYFHPTTGEPITYGDDVPFQRVRYLAKPPETKGLTKKKFMKYSQPAGSGVQIYFPQSDKVDWQEVFDDIELPIVITEGEKKALRCVRAGIPCIGLGGVSSFGSGGDLHSDLDAVPMDGRTIIICYDSDADSNPNIQAAEGRLATELSLHKKADVLLCRLPKLKGQDKTGIDDFIKSEGEDAFAAQLEKALPMRRIDAAVLGLNDSIAWIEKEGLVYDIESTEFIHKTNFVAGSKYSALKLLVPTQKGTGTKSISVTTEWLTHPHARRHEEVLFNPNTDEEILTTERGTALNLWRGWDPEEGDVQPFLDLSAHLFAELPEDQQDLPLKLLAYKAQNPGTKVPLALVLLGQQGCGKSLWARIVREAFSPYGAAIPSAALVSTFNGWVERSLIAVIDEAQSVHLVKGNDVLKNLITDQRQNLNEKFRPARQVDSYTMYILTSNDRRVGSYSGDDRRMVVISSPPKRDDGFYDRIGRWRGAGGCKHLLAYLLNYDLQGWVPPKTAPLTAEKYMAYMESLTPLQRLAEEMRTADHNVVALWLKQSLAWANEAIMSDNRDKVTRATEIKAAVDRIQVRPFYTPEELAMMFPSIVGQLHGYQAYSAPSGEISRQLRECGVPYLRSKDDPRGFMQGGMLRQYLIIADRDEWTVPIGQDYFEQCMKNFPRYGEM